MITKQLKFQSNKTNHLLMSKFNQVFNAILLHCQSAHFISLLLQIMYEFTHDHLNYDEIIEDDTELIIETDSPSNKEKTFRINTKQGKPFWLEKDSRKQDMISKPRLLEIKRESFERNMKVEDKEDPENLEDYEEDFEQFSQSYYESIAKQSKRGSSMLDYQDYNKSDQLPVISKIKLRVNNSHRYGSDFTKPVSKQLCKSTMEIRRQNSILIQQINSIKSLLPKYRQNRKIIASQREQMRNFKKLEDRVFDADYEFFLDKAVSKSVNRQTELKKILDKKQRRIASKDKNFLKKQASPKQEGELDKVYRVREQLMSKMREDIANQEKLIELDRKILHYEEVMRDMDDKIYHGSADDLRKRIIFLEFDVSYRKTALQTRCMELMSQISQLNNEISQTEVNLMKVGKQAKQIVQENNTEKRISLSKDISTENQPTAANPEDMRKTNKVFKANITPKITPKREKLFRFFKANRQ